MLVNTDEGDTFSFEEISSWLTEAGFTNPRTSPPPAHPPSSSPPNPDESDKPHCIDRAGLSSHPTNRHFGTVFCRLGSSDGKTRAPFRKIPPPRGVPRKREEIANRKRKWLALAKPIQHRRRTPETRSPQPPPHESPSRPSPAAPQSRTPSQSGDPSPNQSPPHAAAAPPEC